MPFIMLIMHAYGRLVHRPDPQTWTGTALLPPLDPSRPSARPEALTQAR
jgi:hypothetical protein